MRPRLCPTWILVCSAVVAAQTPEGVKLTGPGEIRSVEADVAGASKQNRFFDIINSKRSTGDCRGAGIRLEEDGIELGLGLTTIYQHNAHGGLQARDGHRMTGSVDYEVIFDFEAMGLVNGGTAYVLGESTWNDGIGKDRVGTLFGVNGDAAGDHSIVVSELWYEQTFWNGKARFRFGKIDVSLDFDANAYANDETSQFLNPALINTMNIPMPNVGLGAQLVVQPVDWMYAGIVATDAQAYGRETGFGTAFHDEDYFFCALELGFLPIWDTSRGSLPGAYRFGVWYDPQPKEVFFSDLAGQRRTVPLKSDDLGFYFNMDQMLWKENLGDEADAQGLGMFFRYGYANEDCNEIEHFWSIGAQYQGLIPTRDNDVLGFGFAQSILSGELRRLDGVDRESVYELYYNAQISPWLTVTPDVQYVVNPGADEGRDSFVVGVRLQMSFLRQP